MKKTLVTAALAGSLLVASPAPARATTASEGCPSGPEIVDHVNCALERVKWAFNTACIFVPVRPCYWD